MPYVSRTRNHFFETVATTSPPRLISYSWSTMLPWALSSSPPSTSMAKRSRIPTSALWIVARVRPSRSTSIVSRTRSFFSRIRATSWPSRSSRMKVSRTRSALPSTLYRRSPWSSSIQESSPMEASFSRIWKRCPAGSSWWRRSRAMSLSSRGTPGRYAGPAGRASPGAGDRDLAARSVGARPSGLLHVVGERVDGGRVQDLVPAPEHVGPRRAVGGQADDLLRDGAVDEGQLLVQRVVAAVAALLLGGRVGQREVVAGGAGRPLRGVAGLPGDDLHAGEVPAL